MYVYTVTNRTDGPTLFATDDALEATMWAQGNAIVTGLHHLVTVWNGADSSTFAHIYPN